MATLSEQTTPARRQARALSAMQHAYALLDSVPFVRTTRDTDRVLMELRMAIHQAARLVETSDHLKQQENR